MNFDEDVEEDEVFEDAENDDNCEMSLSTSIEQAKLASNFFFNNKFDEARAIMQPWSDKSMYHALGHGTFLYLQAVMTFDPHDIEQASDGIKRSVEVCNRFRRKNTIGESIGKMVKKPDYNTYTEEEIHAELCYAECLLLRAILTFIEDETLISFLKGGIKIRACYQSFKECSNILENRDMSGDQFKIHFESGVRMGVGTFNLLVSQLPMRILKLLEFAGFASSRPFGLKELERGFSLQGSLRKVLCGLVLLAYHSFVVYAYGSREGEHDTIKRILDDQLKLYPNGALFLFFQARYNYIRGSFGKAAELYNTSRLSQTEWTQFHHICFWEIFWVKCMEGNYKEAGNLASILLRESRWSKAIYAYQKAICLCMRKDSLTIVEEQELCDTMRNIPELKQKIAGKSLPMEKFAVKKSLRFFNQNKCLVLPCVEFMYVWNAFIVLSKCPRNMEKIYCAVEIEQNKLKNLKIADRNEYYWDNLLLAHLLKGACLAHMDSPLQAAEALKYIISNEKNIKEDTYIVPYALHEAALLHYNDGEYEQARVILEHTKNNFKGYLLESRLHFRIHSTLNRVRSQLNRKLSTNLKETAFKPTNTTFKLANATFKLPNTLKIGKSSSPQSLSPTNRSPVCDRNSSFNTKLDYTLH